MALASDETYRSILGIFEKAERDSLAWNSNLLSPGKIGQRLLFLNSHAINMAVSSSEFRAALLEGDLLLRDGVGVEIAFQFLGLRETENLNGTDLIPKILDDHKSRKIAVWGSSQIALDHLRQRLEREGFPHLAPMYHGFHEDAFYVEAFNRDRPEILVLCMGMPRQEVLAYKLPVSAQKCLVICGGGWANFHSGHIKRAPALMRRYKLEWVHRLAREPLRVGKRYTLGVMLYFLTLRRIRNLRERGAPPSPD